MEKNHGIDLEDLNVIITGAARGLGAALALTLSDMGCNVVLCSRSLGALERTTNRIEARTGNRPPQIEMDLADTGSVESGVQEILVRLPRVDILINNGMTWLERRETPYLASEVMSVINSALTGTFLLTQSLIPLLQKSARPDVVTIGSVTGLPNAGLHNTSVPFYAAKHGQTALADGLRQMFLGTPIRSICIHPPWIRDISPLDEEWDMVHSLDKQEMVTNRDVVDAVLFSVTRPRHVTIASMVLDSDIKGMDARSFLD